MFKIAIGTEVEKAWIMIRKLEEHIQDSKFCVVLPEPNLVQIRTAEGHSLRPWEINKAREFMRKEAKCAETSRTVGNEK